MDSSKYFKVMAVYNKRMNKQLLDVCSNLSEDQLHKETNSFFESILSYWNHILFGDLIMLKRFSDNNISQSLSGVIERLPVAKTGK